MSVTCIDYGRMEDLLWRLEVIESRLRSVGKVDLCSEFTCRASGSLSSSFIWWTTTEGYEFWSGLQLMLVGHREFTTDRVITARKAVTKYLKESGYEL